MKSKLLIVTLLLTLNARLQAQTADDYVTEGRGFLSVTNIISANHSFSNAVVANPTHPTANVLYGITRLLVLQNQPAISNFLTRVGLPATGRDIYNWQARLPLGADNLLVVPSGVNGNEFAGMLRTHVLPELIRAEANLAAVTDTNYTLNLTSSETRIQNVTLDWGDIVLIRSGLKGAQYFCYAAYSWNTDAQLSVIWSLYTNHQFSFERLLKDYPNLMKFATTNDLNAALGVFKNGADLYFAASQYIRNRPYTLVRLFNYDSSKDKNETYFRLTLADLKSSLSNRVALTADPRYQVRLSTVFEGKNPPRSYLPQFASNNFVVGTLPDATFGGLINGLSTGEWESYLISCKLKPLVSLRSGFMNSNHLFQFQFSDINGSGFVIQTSTNLQNWDNAMMFPGFGETLQYIDDASPAYSRRYYRVQDITTNMPPFVENPTPLTGLGITADGYVKRGSSSSWNWISPVSALVTVAPKTSGENVYVEVNAPYADGWDSPTKHSGYAFYAVAGRTYRITAHYWYNWYYWDWQNPMASVRLRITTPPSLFVTSPFEGRVVFVPTNLTVQAQAVDLDGTIAMMRCHADDVLLGSTTNANLVAPYLIKEPGVHEIKVEAADNLGASTTQWITVSAHPGNDYFSRRTILTGTSVDVTGSNAEAGKDAGEPDHAGSPGGASVWWSWTAPFTGSATILADMKPLGGSPAYWSPPSPLLGVYTGNSVSNLTPVASSGSQYGGAAQVTIAAVAGTTYQIAVDALYATKGNINLKIVPTQPPAVIITAPLAGSVFVWPTDITLSAFAYDNDGSIAHVDFYDSSCYPPCLIGTAQFSPYSLVWSNRYQGYFTVVAKATDNAGIASYSTPVSFTMVAAPQNDNFASAITLTGGAFTDYRASVGASKESGEPNHAYNSGGKSVWWRWTAPKSGTVTITTVGSDFDTLLGVYTGTSVSGLTLVAQDDDSAGNKTSRVIFSASSGTSYEIAVDGYLGVAGNITLNLSQP